MGCDWRAVSSMGRSESGASPAVRNSAHWPAANHCPKMESTIGVAVHPDGRMLACAMTDGFGLWDLENGVEIGFIPSRLGQQPRSV